MFSFTDILFIILGSVFFAGTVLSAVVLVFFSQNTSKAPDHTAGRGHRGSRGQRKDGEEDDGDDSEFDSGTPEVFSRRAAARRTVMTDGSAVYRKIVKERKESTHWVENVFIELIVWTFLCGATGSDETCNDRLLYLVNKLLDDCGIGLNSPPHRQLQHPHHHHHHHRSSTSHHHPSPPHLQQHGSIAAGVRTRSSGPFLSHPRHSNPPRAGSYHRLENSSMFSNNNVSYSTRNSVLTTSPGVPPGGGNAFSQYRATSSRHGKGASSDKPLLYVRHLQMGDDLESHVWPLPLPQFGSISFTRERVVRMPPTPQHGQRGSAPVDATRPHHHHHHPLSHPFLSESQLSASDTAISKSPNSSPVQTQRHASDASTASSPSSSCGGSRSSALDFTLTQFVLPLEFTDDGLVVDLKCEIPLLFGAGKKLGISNAMLKLPAQARVTSVKFKCELVVRFYSHKPNIIDFSFQNVPELDLRTNVAIGRERAAQTISGGEKASEIIHLALQRLFVVHPNVLRLTVVAGKDESDEAAGLGGFAYDEFASATASSAASPPSQSGSSGTRLVWEKVVAEY